MQDLQPLWVDTKRGAPLRDVVLQYSPPQDAPPVQQCAWPSPRVYMSLSTAPAGRGGCGHTTSYLCVDEYTRA